MHVKLSSIAVLLILLSALIAGCPASDTGNGTSNGRSGPDAEAATKAGFGTEFDRPGFVTTIRDGRLWVFRKGSPELADFQKKGELAKHVTRIGAGPKGMTIKAADVETLDAYKAAAQ
jgi:hypothetical protein